MEKNAQAILDIIGDYRNDYGIQITTGKIIEWVKQFEENDRDFILSELLHLLRQGIYVSKEKAKQLLDNALIKQAKFFKYQNITSYLQHSKILDVQRENKSQKDIINLLDNLLKEKYNMSIDDCRPKQIKNYIYFDDIIATGKTLKRELTAFLQEKQSGIDHYELLLNDKINLIISVFCQHNWGWANAKWSLMQQIDKKIENKLVLCYEYEIQNNINFHNPQLNLAYPIDYQEQVVHKYLNNLEASNYDDRAFRKLSTPINEKFYSSKENRVRFEKIILLKGLEIISKVKAISKGLRPLGYTSHNHKTLGLGTMFFTWRNIPNNSPIVFWWDNPAHDWKGLFPLGNRGL